MKTPKKSDEELGQSANEAEVTWEKIQNEPLKQAFKRIPKKYHTHAALLLCFLVALVPFGIWGVKFLRSHSHPLPTFLARPFHEVPYGYAYSYAADGQLEMTRAFPTVLKEMHARVFDVGPSYADPNQIKEAYRIVIANDTTSHMTVNDLSLVLVDYQPVPSKYVCLWDRKGIKRSITVEVKLSPDMRSASLLAPEQTLHLKPDESEIVLARIASAQPGVYKVRFDAKICYLDGKFRNISSRVCSLFVPVREGNAEEHSIGACLIGKCDRRIAEAILNLSEELYKSLCEHTNPDSWNIAKLPEEQLNRLLSLKGHEFFEFLKSLQEQRGFSPPQKKNLKSLPKTSLTPSSVAM